MEAIVTGSLLSLVIVSVWAVFVAKSSAGKVTEGGEKANVGVLAAAAWGAVATTAEATAPMKRAGALASVRTTAILRCRHRLLGGADGVRDSGMCNLQVVVRIGIETPDVAAMRGLGAGRATRHTRATFGACTATRKGHGGTTARTAKGISTKRKELYLRLRRPPAPAERFLNEALHKLLGFLDGASRLGSTLFTALTMRHRLAGLETSPKAILGALRGSKKPSSTDGRQRARRILTEFDPSQESLIGIFELDVFAPEVRYSSIGCPDARHHLGGWLNQAIARKLPLGVSFILEMATRDACHTTQLDYVTCTTKLCRDRTQGTADY